MTPLSLEVRPSGEIRVQLGNQLPTLLDRVSFENGTLHGVFRGTLDVPEAERRPYIVSISLRLRDDTVLNGAVTARADGNGTMPSYNVASFGHHPEPAVRVEKDTFVLSQWGELHKQ